MEGQKLYFPHHKTEGVFRVAKYRNGRLAIIINCNENENEEILAVLTVNLPDEELKLGQFFVKGWSENENIANICRSSGLFRDTGERVPTGYAEAEVWEFANDSDFTRYFLEEYNAKT